MNRAGVNRYGISKALFPVGYDGAQDYQKTGRQNKGTLEMKNR
jgi:hypothetical protein